MDRCVVKKLAALCGRYLLAKKLTLVLVVMIPVITHGQEGNRVSGKVVNNAGALMIGNVMALSVRDSSFLKGKSFLDGNFKLAELTEKEVLIKLTSLQFDDTLFHIVFAEKKSVDLGAIVISDRSQMLDVVEIVGSAPLFESRPDGVMEVHVANTVLATSNSVIEILSRSPNVISSEEGISVFGRGQAILYLNGKRVPHERLSSISASQVKSIEIISNPSAIYDAEGRAVINIITKDDLPDGYRGTAQQQVSWSEFAGTTTSTMVNLNYRKRKIDFEANYDLKLGADNELLNTTRLRPAEDDYLNSVVRWKQQREYNNVSNYSLGASYDLDGKGYASLEYNGSYENMDDHTTSRNHITTPDENGLYTSLTKRSRLTRNNSVTVNVNRVFDSLGTSFFVGGQFSRYLSHLLDDITENNLVNDQQLQRLLKSDQKTDISIYNPQVDFVKVFTAGSKLGIGAKLSYAKALSHLWFYGATSERYELDVQRSNDFEYAETVPAAYIQYDGAFNSKVTYGVGLRSEWTNYTLRTAAQNASTFRSHYVNLFPNAQINVALNKLKLRAAYTSRITRPAYQALSPSLLYQDAFTSAEGNPNLMPEKTHSFEAGASLKAFDLKTGYSYTIDPLNGAAIRGVDQKSYILKRLNFKEGHSYFTTLSASISNRWLTSINTASLSYTRLVDDQYGYEQVGSRPQVYFYTSNKINVGNLFNLHVLAWYLGEKYYGVRYDKRRTILTVGIEKDLFNKFLKCSFTANDIFFTTNFAGEYTVGETFIIYDRYFNTNYFRLAVVCNFGQLKKSLYKSRATGVDENSRAR
jgi:hypothetical protein